MSPSGSVKYWEALIAAFPPGLNVRAGTLPTGCGARLACATVTLTRRVAVSPPGSCAVIVTIAPPVATPVIVTVDPETETVATLVLDDAAV